MHGGAEYASIAAACLKQNNKRENAGDHAGRKGSAREESSKMPGKIMNTLLAGSAIGGAAAGGAAAVMARNIVWPKTFSLEEEKAWLSKHGMWGDYDQVPRTNYTVAGKDGYLLHCEYALTNPGSRKYMILTHGYTSNRYGSLKYLGVYRALGFNCVLYDCRGHGENAPSPCSIGNLESEDLLHLIEDTYQRYGEDIELGLHGESMGSAASLSVLKFHPRVKFVVADCGFASLYDLMGRLYRENHVGFMLDPVNLMMGKRYHFTLKQTCPRDALLGNEVPLCLIHGAEDTFIAPENSDELAQATSGYQEVHKVEGAEHARSSYVLGEEGYKEIVEAFLGNLE